MCVQDAILSVLAGIASGLAYIKGKGVIHGDIKPQVGGRWAGFSKPAAQPAAQTRPTDRLPSEQSSSGGLGSVCGSWVGCVVHGSHDPLTSDL